MITVVAPWLGRRWACGARPAGPARGGPGRTMRTDREVVPCTRGDFGVDGRVSDHQGRRPGRPNRVDRWCVDDHIT